MLNLNAGNLFEMSELTAEVNRTPFIPGDAGKLFADGTDGISTTTAVVDVRDGAITLIDDQNRGGAARANDAFGEQAPVALIAKHFPVEETITPSDFQNIRQFGSDDQLETLQSVRDKKLAIMKKKHALTLEHQRVGAIKGALTNSIGGTVDLFAAFGKAQIELSMKLDVAATGTKGLIMDAMEASEDEVGDLSINGWVALCGKNYFRDFVEHDSVKEAFARYQDSSVLRNDVRGGFMYNDVEWKRYSGKVAGAPLIGDDEAFLCPIADGMYQTRFAPGDFLEAANTMGLPAYAKARELDYGKGIGLWMESNPVSWVSHPGAVIRLKKTDATV